MDRSSSRLDHHGLYRIAATHRISLAFGAPSRPDLPSAALAREPPHVEPPMPSTMRLRAQSCPPLPWSERCRSRSGPSPGRPRAPRPPRSYRSRPRAPRPRLAPSDLAPRCLLGVDPSEFSPQGLIRADGLALSASPPSLLSRVVRAPRASSAELARAPSRPETPSESTRAP
jgi:hypothetical protein